LSAAFVAHALLRGGLRPEWLDPEVRTTRVVFRTCRLVHQSNGEERSGPDAVRADRIQSRVVALLFACARFSGPASLRALELPRCSPTLRALSGWKSLDEDSVPPLTSFCIRRHRLAELQYGRKLSGLSKGQSETFVTGAAFGTAGESDTVERLRTPSVISNFEFLRTRPACVDTTPCERRACTTTHPFAVSSSPPASTGKDRSHDLVRRFISG
jgi:hypothetical protein